MIYEFFSPDEVTKLRLVLKDRHGNVKKAKLKTGLTVCTLLRAAEGKPIHPHSKKTITETLLTENPNQL
jgi:hypothetical protein